jgi:hypothetical protein
VIFSLCSVQPTLVNLLLVTPFGTVLPLEDDYRYLYSESGLPGPVFFCFVFLIRAPYPGFDCNGCGRYRYRYIFSYDPRRQCCESERFVSKVFRMINILTRKLSYIVPPIFFICILEMTESIKNSI